MQGFDGCALFERSDMAIRRVQFSEFGARDIHVLRGTSSNSMLNRFLVTNAAGVLERLDAHLTGHQADFDYEFRPTFKAERKATPAGEVYEGCGMQVGIRTGVVSFLLTPPLTRNNFIVELRIIKNIGGTQNLAPLPVRVQVHPAVRDLRISPPELSVRLQGAGLGTFQRRFTLRAEFTDDTVGDLTDHDGVNWAFAPSTPGVRIGSLLSYLGNAGQKGGVIATWVAAPGKQGTAKIEALPPSRQNTGGPMIEFVDGHRSTWESINGEPLLTGQIRPENVPNVLIFGVGFKAEDASAFQSITHKVVHDLKRDKLTRPFDLLATSMNFWRIAPAATVRGGRKVLHEVYTLGSGADMVAYPVPPAVPIRPSDVDWTLSNVIYHLGLPIPAEASGPGAKSNSDLRAEWTAIRDDTLPPLKVSDEVIDQWKQLGTRQFIDVPNEFGMIQAGEPPEAQEQSTTPMLLMDSHDLAEIRDFLRTRRATSNVGLDGTGFLSALGGLWACITHPPSTTPPHEPGLGDFWPDSNSTPPVFKRFDGTSWIASKEWDFNNHALLVMITASRGGRATGGPMIKVPIEGGNFGIPVVAETGARTLKLNFTTSPPNSVDRSVWRTIAHESGHSFGLGDEYIDFAQESTKTETELAIYGNLMTGALQPQPGAAIDPAKIKWNWLRARRSAVLIKPAGLRPGGALIEIPLRPEDANQFTIGDKLFLRSRRRSAPLTGPLNTGDQAPHESTLLTLTDKAIASPPPGEPAYVNLVVSASPAMTANDLVPFAAGASVFQPREASSPPAGYGPFQRLISKRVFEYMRTNNRPLSPEPYDARDEAEKHAKTHTPPGATYPTVLYSFKNTARIIGLYRGGDRFALGAFHPAGQCMMRNTNANNEFCYVCRYLMVDMIDPRKHWEIDQDYDEHYPD